MTKIATADHRPLEGIKVLDFSTLLPGPMASLVLAEAGAEVTKVERPVTGDEFRAYEPSAIFAVLNRGKRSVTIDLKDPSGAAFARQAALESDILIEQFRPGVMKRFGLSYQDLSAGNPRLIYCSITGYGQTGPKAQSAGHDLNYLAEAGLLSLVTEKDGTPLLPSVPLADIGAGTYPALVNILVALFEREKTGHGRHLDIAMSENILPFMYWALASGAAGMWPKPNSELITGGSPRYHIYQTADGAFLAAAPLEERFWANFCALTGLSVTSSIADVQAVIGARTLAFWEETFRGKDVCVTPVASLRDALQDPQFASRGVFRNRVNHEGETWPALPVALAPVFRDPRAERPAPALSHGTAESADV